MNTYTPTKQLPAREQLAKGVCLPYFVSDLDGPVNYHITLVVLTPAALDDLVIFSRKRAADHYPNPNDNRNGRLDYIPTDRERVDVIRHTLLNRTPMNSHILAGYPCSFDNLLFRIEKKGVDVDARQMELRRYVTRLISEHYPHLALECEHHLFLSENNLRNRSMRHEN